MKRTGVTKAVCESTGGYERLVVGKLRETAINVQVAHPLRVRAFARACGYEAKTDPLDAQVLSRYGVVFSESGRAQPEADPDREELRQLLSRRRQLVEQRVRERNRLDKDVSASVGKSTRRHVRWLDREIDRLDEEYREVLRRGASLCRRAELYRSIPGVGELTAATLVAYLPELGRWDGKALTSLVGLAPSSKDSGRRRGNRSIRGGRGLVRRALYMCAWTTIRVDAALRSLSLEGNNTYLLWKVGKPPDFILEIGSHSTARADLGSKRDLYAELGVGEYWRYDATGGEFYGEPLVGEVLVEGVYRRLEMVREDDGRVWGHSGVLNLALWWAEGDLRFWDPVVGRWVLSHEEERDRAEEERTARLTAESRVAELEAELRRLRGE